MSFDLFGLGQGLNNLQNNLFQQDVNQQSREWDMEMSDLEYRRAVEMWEKTNTYNSPLEQRKRLQMAGLNPALMYGQSASPGIASPAPTWKKPATGHWGEGMGFDYSGLGGMGILSAYNDIRKTNSDLETAVKQRELLQSQKEKTDLESVLKGNLADLWNYYPDTPYAKKYGKQPMTMWEYYQRKWALELEKETAQVEDLRNIANWSTRRWNIWDKEGIDINQMTNLGKVIEKKYGGFAGAFIDAMVPKIKFSK